MIKFSVSAEANATADEICEAIFDVENWKSFDGYGPLPGIERATITSSSDARVGTIFSVENSDGSRHKEVVESYIPGESLVMRMYDFSAPLCHMAVHFVERWDLSNVERNGRIVREFELHPKSPLWNIPLWLISHLLRRAVLIQTKEIGSMGSE